jgi:predicted dithiol-disulfide oxidoreductase (DUF899 family)
MTYETINNTFRQTNLQNESGEYLAKREELRIAELELMRQREQVAALRRALPQGAAVQDYVFEEGPSNLDVGDEPIRKVRLSELFTAPGRAVVLYHFMYGKKQANPCPMCTMLIDGWSNVAHHLAQNVDVAIVAAADPGPLRAYGRKRGWNQLRLLSCGSNTFKYDLGGENREGAQDSAVSVFITDADGTLRHFSTAHPRMAADVNERGLDLLFSVYSILDITPYGRGSWYASLNYAPGPHDAGR